MGVLRVACIRGGTRGRRVTCPTRSSSAAWPEHRVLDTAQSRGGRARRGARAERAKVTRVSASRSGHRRVDPDAILDGEPIARDRLAVAERNLGDRARRVTELEPQAAGLVGELGDANGARANARPTTATSARSSPTSARPRERRRNPRSEREPAAEAHPARPRSRTADGGERALAGRNSQNWFIVGAAVLFGGIVIGLVAPSLRRKRRSDW